MMGLFLRGYARAIKCSLTDKNCISCGASANCPLVELHEELAKQEKVKPI